MATGCNTKASINRNFKNDKICKFSFMVDEMKKEIFVMVDEVKITFSVMVYEI